MSFHKPISDDLINILNSHSHKPPEFNVLRRLSLGLPDFVAEVSASKSFGGSLPPSRKRNVIVSGHLQYSEDSYPILAKRYKLLVKVRLLKYSKLLIITARS